MIKLVILTLMAPVFLSQCTTNPQKKAVQKWQSKMDQFSALMTDLYPLLVSANEFEKPDHKERIQNNVKQLSHLAHSLSDKKEPSSLLIASSNDPSLKYLSQMMEQEIDSALDGIDLDKMDYSRVILKNLTGICIECHTRGNWGKSFKSQFANNSQFQSLDDFDRAELYTATRQYDEALKIYEAIFDHFAKNKGYHFRWEKAAKLVLNLSVRIKQDPDLGLKIVDKILAQPHVALFLKSNARRWKRDLKTWKREKPVKGDQQKFKFAKKLVNKAQLSQNYWGDSSTYVLYLRASALLHEILSSTKVNDNIKAESLYLLGQAYESLSAHNYSKLYEYYYKSCVTYKPHTKLALKCYQRFEASVFLGYSGSGGFSAPPSSLDYLNYLKGLAQPK